MKRDCQEDRGTNTKFMREGIEERHWKEAQDNIEVVAKTIEVYTKEVKQATSIVKPKAF